MRLKHTLPIRHQEVFAAVSAHGHKATDQYLMLLYLPHTSALTLPLTPARKRYDTSINYLGFKLSKRLAHAVIRNKLRRRLRAIYLQLRLQGQQHAMLAPGYLVIIPRHASKIASYQQLVQSFNLGLKRITAISKKTISV